MKGKLKLGDHWVISDISGFKFPASEMRGTWNNLLVHESEWEPKHPQLTIKSREDDQSVNNVRLRPEDQFPTQITQDDL